jgi:hypothetical protein
MRRNDIVVAISVERLNRIKRQENRGSEGRHSAGVDAKQGNIQARVTEFSKLA